MGASRASMSMPSGQSAISRSPGAHARTISSTRYHIRWTPCDRSNYRPAEPARNKPSSEGLHPPATGLTPSLLPLQKEWMQRRPRNACGRPTPAGHCLQGEVMAPIDLKALVGRFNEHTRRALEAAAGLTLSRSHYNVEIEHWLFKLAEGTDTDIAAILRHYEADHGRLMADLNRGMDRMKTGNARAPSLSPEIV